MRTFLMIFLLCTAVNTFSQTNIVDSLQQKIEFLEKRLDEKNYTRVPAEDLEKLLDNKVSAEVYNSLWKWIAGLVVFIGFVGFLVRQYSRTLISEDVQKEVDKKNTELQSKLDNIHKDLQKENQSQDQKINSLQADFEKFKEAQQTFRDETTKAIDDKLRTSFRVLSDNVAEIIENKVIARKYKGADLIEEIEAALNNSGFNFSKGKKIKLVDTLVKCYYYTSDIKDQSEKIINSVRAYEKEFELLTETYATIAIYLTNQYEYYGTKALRDSCLEACEKSISRLNDYGIPYTSKLEVFAIDYAKAFDDTEKQSAIENIKKTMNAIKHNQSPHLCKEIVNRFNSDYAVDYLKPYINWLNENFPDDMNTIRDRANPTGVPKNDNNGEDNEDQ
jgi:hypothetical protein